MFDITSRQGSPVDGSVVDQLVASLFSGSTPRHGPYLAPGGGDLAGVREEIIPGLLFRYDLVDVDSRPVALQIYLDIAALGGLMWEQDVRVLLRANAFRHPALPEIVDGGYEGHDLIRQKGFDFTGFAFVVARGSVHDLATVSSITDHLRANPVAALQHFSLLASALGTLHEHGLIHRNIWPGTIDVEAKNQDSNDLVLRLSRFEMSALIANLLKTSTFDAQHGGKLAKDLLLSQRNAGRALAYAPPERIEFLFPGENGAGFLDDQYSDVYSLAVVVWEWFFNTITDEPPTDLRNHQHVRDWARTLHQKLVGRLASERTLPRRLCDLFSSMLAENPRDRPHAAEVVKELSNSYAALTSHFAGSTSELPFLVAYMPRESIPTIHEWGWITTSPTSSEGRSELGAFLEHELRNTVLVHSPHGADPYLEAGASAAKQEAQYVLLGERGAWFCQPYRPRDPLGIPTGKPLDEVLLIKYVVPLDSPRARGIHQLRERDRFKQSVSPIEAFAYDIHPKELESKLPNRPRWTPLLEAIRSPSEAAPHELAYQQALDWLLEYQGVQLRAREYAYERVDDGTVGLVRLVFDYARDSARQHTSALLAKYSASSRRRPPFAYFFAALGSEVEHAWIQVVGDDRGTPSDRLFSGKVECHSAENDTTILVKLDPTTGWLPERGWLRPYDDRGSRVALRRQLDARWDLLDDRVLLDQFRNPLTVRGFPERWQQALDTLPGRQLRGDSSDVVLDMLVSQPFFAVQGPPGTGKTEVASRAVAAFLTAERGSRVLVSAQANYALDNLAVRLLRQLGVLDANNRMVVKRDLLPLRIVSPSSDSVDGTVMEQFTLSKLAPERIRIIVEEVEQDRREKGDDDPWSPIRAEYLKVLPNSLPELDDRFLRSANLVFATCLAATRRALVTTDSGLFDWVVVEEAAKAWPGELSIPLSQGLRWALLGDHKQLPAHRRDEVLAFLHECANDENPDINLHGRRVDVYREVFELFAGLFEKPVDGPRRLHRPLRRLTGQFRMRDSIGELVSRVFYPVVGAEWNGGPLPPGALRSLADIPHHGLTTPEWLSGHDLVWLDTAGVHDCKNEGAWYNEGEVSVIEELVRRLRPDPKDRLIVLTPYREQARHLSRSGVIGRRVSTIPAFQGKEAEIVVVSLVRDRTRELDEPVKNIGYLIQPELVNVMVSRARQLLVIVGDFAHFAAVGDFWAKLCAGVEQFGVRISAEKVLER